MGWTKGGLATGSLLCLVTWEHVCSEGLEDSCSQPPRGTPPWPASSHGALGSSGRAGQGALSQAGGLFSAGG